MTNPWRERLARLGHTGWNDPVVYAYDQRERLGIVSRLLERLGPRKGGAVALDFGCGSGDFSRLLLEHGFRVFGLDPFVRPAIDDPRFTYLSADHEIDTGLPPVDLVLSVTVLDHVVDDDELQRTLRQIRRPLKPGGVLCLYEYALDDAESAPPSMRPGEFQAFRTLADWRRHLGSAGFAEPEVRAVPHPLQSPSGGYRSYRKSLAVRFAARIGPVRFKGLLDRAAERCLEAHPPAIPHPAPSPLKLLVARTG